MTSVLGPELRALFFSQQSADQRHAADVATLVEWHDEVSEAALLHDVGKTAADLGAYGRSMATIWSRTGLPIRGRWLAYLEHGPRGAVLLEEAGASGFTVAFTRGHPGRAPDGVNGEAWSMLAHADDA